MTQTIRRIGIELEASPSCGWRGVHRSMGAYPSIEPTGVSGQYRAFSRPSAIGEVN